MIRCREILLLFSCSYFWCCSKFPQCVWRCRVIVACRRSGKILLGNQCETVRRFHRLGSSNSLWSNRDFRMLTKNRVQISASIANACCFRFRFRFHCCVSLVIDEFILTFASLLTKRTVFRSELHVAANTQSGNSHLASLLPNMT